MRASKRFEGTRPAIPCASEDGPAGHPSRLPFGAPERDLDGARPAGQEPDLTTGNGRLCSGGREKDLRSRGNEKSVPLGAIPTKIEPVICPTKNSSAPPKLFTMSWQRFVHHVLELDTSRPAGATSPSPSSPNRAALPPAPRPSRIRDGMRRLVAGADSVKLATSEVFPEGRNRPFILKGGDQP